MFRTEEYFDLFAKKLSLYHDAVELQDKIKRRLALLFNLQEDAFRLAEQVVFPDSANPWNDWILQLKSLFERTQTMNEKRYNSNHRTQEPGESPDTYSVSLKNLEQDVDLLKKDSHNVIDQFISGIRDLATQNKLLQERSTAIDEAVFEAANATIQPVCRVWPILTRSWVYQQVLTLSAGALWVPRHKQNLRGAQVRFLGCALSTCSKC